jgi:hypothetical protein
MAVVVALLRRHVKEEEEFEFEGRRKVWLPTRRAAKVHPRMVNNDMQEAIRDCRSLLVSLGILHLS